MSRDKNCHLEIKRTNMKNRIAFILFVLPLAFFSQGIDRKAEFAPSTPNVTEIMRHSLVPVNQYTGIPDISIPIYSIDFDGKTIPVRLQYHAGGIKTNQEASWIGLGWSLSANAVISRQINYKSDIGQGMRFGRSGSTAGAYCFDTAVPNVITNSYRTQIASHVGPTSFDQKDTQPDIFTASLFGEVVKFQLTQKSVTNDIQTMILNDSKAIVEYNEFSQNFTIRDDRGFTYHFTHKEYVSYISETSSGLVDNILEFDGGINYNIGSDLHIITSWFLDFMVSPNGRVLDFNYYGDGTEVLNQDEDDIYLSISATNVQASNGFANCLGSLVNMYPNNSVTYSYQRSLMENKYLKEIIDQSSGERLVFHIGERNDIIGLDDAQINTAGILGTNSIYPSLLDIKPPKKMEFLEVYAPNGKRVKKIEFWQSYFNQPVLNQANDDNLLRLKLDSIAIDNAVHRFDYYMPNSLPAKNTTGRDFWGFYNGNDGQVPYPTHRIESDFFIGFCNPQGLPSNGTLISGGNLGSDFNHGKIGILERMGYPTGGFTKFDYESNKAKVSSDPPSDHYLQYASMYLDENNQGLILSSTTENNTRTYEIGGLRVKTVTNTDDQGNPLLKKSYRYDGFDGSSVPMSSGKLMDDLLFYNPAELYDAGNSHLATTLISTSSNRVYSNPSAQGNHVGYSIVEETIESTENATETNGRIVTTFRNEPNISLQSTNHQSGGASLDAPPLTFDAGNGKVLNQKIYNSSFGSSPKREIINNYIFHSEDVSTAHKLYISNMMLVFLSANASGTFSYLYDWFTYKTKRSYALMTSSSVRDYFDNGTSLEEVTAYTYDNRPLLKSKSLGLSDGNILKEEYYYPFDTSFGVSTYSNMSRLVVNNMIGTPVYTRRYRGSQLLNHEFVSYDVFNGSDALPSEIAFQQEDAVLSDMESRITYHAYDPDGNPLEISQDSGPAIQYLWGYENKYPVAKVENAEANNTPLDIIVDKTVIQNPKTTLASFKNEMDKIRNHPDYQNAMISSYTYDPLVGVTSMTSEYGYTNLFEYDDRERLIRTKDNDGNIIADMDYGFKNESFECLDCGNSVTLSTLEYQLFANNSFNVNYTYTLPTGFGAISEWYINYGESTERGIGQPPSNFTTSYQNEGLKTIRLYLYNAQGEFITGNTNVRVFPGAAFGGDVYFEVTYQGETNPSISEATTGLIHGDPQSIITYSVSVGGVPSGELKVNATVGGDPSETFNDQAAVIKTVEIPSSGVVSCRIETFRISGASAFGGGSSRIQLLETTKGQIVSPSFLEHTFSSTDPE